MSNIIGLDKNPTVCNTASKHHIHAIAYEGGLDLKSWTEPLWLTNDKPHKSKS